MPDLAFVVKDPDKAYLGTQLWLPKKHINAHAVKASLEFTVASETGQEFLQLWEDSGQHLAVPREYIRQDDYRTLLFPIVDLTPTSFPRTSYQSHVVLDFLEPKSDTQKRAFKAFSAVDHGILNLACGKGKTTIALHHIAKRGMNALIIVNQTTILDQWHKSIQKFLSFEGGIGLIQGSPDGWDWRHPITIAMLHSLARYPDHVTPDIRRHFGLVIWDECFVAGTPVDGVPIERRHVGDLIWSFDEVTGTFSKQPIEKIFVSRPQILVSVAVGGIEIICTPGHPFWTQRGWVPAYLLTCADVVLCSNHGQEHLQVRESSFWKGHREVLRRVRESSDRRTNHKVRASMRLVQEASVSPWPQGHGAIQEDQAGLLFQGVHGSLGVGRSLEKDARHQRASLQDQFQAHAETQSHEGSSHQGEAAYHSPSNGVEAHGSRWKREALASSSENASEGSGLGNGSSGQHRAQALEGIVNSLQDRHREQSVEDSDRSRWTLPQLPLSQETGSEKDGLSTWTRVGGVEVLQPGSDGTFGGRCPDGLVYNFQVKGTPTYSVSPLGVVVHNCHHLSAPYFCVTATMFPGQRYGLSATVSREDGTEVVYNYHIGDPFYKDLMQTVKPNIRFRQTPFLIPEADYQEIITDMRGNPNVSKLRVYVGAMPDRNEYVALDLMDAVRAGRKVLALSHSKEQLKLLHAMFLGLGVDCGICTGDQKVAERWKALREKQIIFGTHQLVMEAIDEDSLDTLFWLTPFGSSHPDGGKNALQQGMGRIQGYRFREGMKHPLVVIFDDVYIKQFHKMCNKLRLQMRRWPVDEGGPYDYTSLKARPT